MDAGEQAQPRGNETHPGAARNPRWNRAIAPDGCPSARPRRILREAQPCADSPYRDRNYGLHQRQAGGCGTPRTVLPRSPMRVMTGTAIRSRRTTPQPRAADSSNNRGRRGRAIHCQLRPGIGNILWGKLRQEHHPANSAGRKGGVNGNSILGERQTSLCESKRLTKVHPYPAFPGNQGNGVPRAQLPTASVVLLPHIPHKGRKCRP